MSIHLGKLRMYSLLRHSESAKVLNGVIPDSRAHSTHCRRYFSARALVCWRFPPGLEYVQRFGFAD